MNRIDVLGAIMVTTMLSAGADAQGTLGELLDAGARKLTKEEVQAAFSGVRSTGKTATGADGEYEFKADGTYSGMVQAAHGGALNVIGTWNAGEGGRLCVEWTTIGRGASKGGGCGFYYVLSNQYYLAESDSNRGSPVLKRTLRK